MGESPSRKKLYSTSSMVTLLKSRSIPYMSRSLVEAYSTLILRGFVMAVMTSFSVDVEGYPIFLNKKNDVG